VNADIVRLAAPRPGAGRIRVGEIWIDRLGFAEAIEAIDALVTSGVGGAVFTPNVDHVVTAERDLAFRAAYAEAALSLADGMPLLWAARWLGTPLPEKVSGSDLVWPLMERAARRRWRVYLLGGASGVAEAARERLERELGVIIAGTDAPHLSLEGRPEEDAVLERVRSARPDLVLVALGAPKQERWIHRALPRLRPAVALGIGASLDFVTGRVRRCPPWMSRAGLEWLYRLSREPTRLAHRYLVKDARFPAIVLRTARLSLEERSTPGGPAADEGALAHPEESGT
jgi:N-acetylglucosaminyldiphosphoundecaprenol N-acetyl-beta-D-mannosaminyltransferase